MGKETRSMSLCWVQISYNRTWHEVISFDMLYLPVN
jgi:hypothetical protein